MKLISIILIFLAGNCKGVMDTLQFHFDRCVFSNPNFNQQFWNPDLSWTNKDVNHDPAKGQKKWLGFIPIPVFESDGWHLAQFFFLNLFTLVIIFYHPIINTNVFNTDVYNIIVSRACDFLLLGAALRAGFVLQYNYLLLKKKP